MNWAQFLDFLDANVDWNDASITEFNKVEYALRQLSQNRHEITARIHEILDNSSLFKQYQPHMECPRLCMDKFVIYMDPQDRFRVRVHRFKSQLENRGAQPTIHTHRWGYSTLILKGEYVQHSYEIESEDHKSMTAKLRVVESQTFKEGDTYSFLPGLAHRTVNESPTDSSFTLFIRGRATCSASKVYDLESNRFRTLMGLDDQLKRELLNLVETLTIGN